MFEVWLNIISMECVSMGFFNYSKPGPGIDKNAPKKKGSSIRGGPIKQYNNVFGSLCKIFCKYRRNVV